MDDALETVSLATNKRQAALIRQLDRVNLSQKDDDTAFLIELLGGIFGLLGLGYIYAGLTNAGLIRLIGYWVGLGALWTLFVGCATVTFGLGICLVPLVIAVQIGVGIWSAKELKRVMTLSREGFAGSGGGGGHSDFDSLADYSTEVPVPPPAARKPASDESER